MNWREKFYQTTIKRKETNRDINILHRCSCNLGHCSSKYYKTYAFTVQNSRFRSAKAQLSIFDRIIFTKSNQKTLTTSLEKNTKNTPVRDKFIMQIALFALIFLYIQAVPLTYSHKSNMP
jgi:hypothetical protein